MDGCGSGGGGALGLVVGVGVADLVGSAAELRVVATGGGAVGAHGAVEEEFGMGLLFGGEGKGGGVGGDEEKECSAQGG